MRISLRWRLLLLAVLPLFFYVVSGFYLLKQQDETFDQMSEQIYETANQTDSLVLNADRDMYQAYLAFLRIESGTLDQAAMNESQEELKDNIQQVIERMGEAENIIKERNIQELSYGNSGRSLEEIMVDARDNFAIWSAEAVKAAADGTHVFDDNTIRSSFETSRNGIDEVGEIMDTYAEQIIADISERKLDTQIKVFASIIVLTLILSSTTLITVYQIMRTIRNVVSKTKLVTEGDLTAQADQKYSKDELGQISAAVDSMIGTMRQLISGIAMNAGEVSKSSADLTMSASESASASREVAQLIQEVADGSEAQSRGASETSKAIEEMAIGIQRIAENTSSIAEQSTSTSQRADQGQASLVRLIDQMSEVTAVIGKLSETVNMLEQRSQEIGAITENITSFSNQTNILSLNASIEAARAGEHGKGFAVVAEEIRRLAASSLESAEGINQLVEVIRSEISGASGYMNQTINAMEQGSDRIKDVRDNLDIIVSSIVEMNEQVHENSAITQQMSASSEQVSASMESAASTAAVNLEKTENVAAATEEQLALMNNISSAATHLTEIVYELERAISHFKVK